MMECKVIATGSAGNATVINGSILIDCGVPFKALAGDHKGLALVLLTHAHGDHFNHATIRRLAYERPMLRFGCCEWLARPLAVACGVSPRSIDIYQPDGRVYGYGAFAEISVFPLRHDVPNCGYKIKTGGKRIFYATDTNSMSGIAAKDYDLYMLEANYSEADIVERIRAKQAMGLYCHEFDVLRNHLSREKADDWLYQNMSSRSAYIYMHEHMQEALAGA